MEHLCYNRKMLLVLLIVFWSLSSCQNTISPELPDIGIKQENLNHELEIVLLRDNTYQIGNSITLLGRLHPDSGIEIHTDSRFQARMFILDKKVSAWVEVFDPTNSYSEELNIDLNQILGAPNDLILSNTGGKSTNQWMVVLHPDISSDEEVVKLLIVFSGNEYQNGVTTDKKIGAYKIVTLRR